MLHNLNSSQLCNLQGHIICDALNDLLYRFFGTFSPIWEAAQSLEKELISLDYIYFILRISTVKKTESVIGMVVYMGHETKVMKNSQKAKVKNSEMEHMLNKLIVATFMLQSIWCLFFGYLAYTWSTEVSKQHL